MNDGQPETTDDDEGLSPRRLTTHDQRLPALTQPTAGNVSAHTRLLTDEQQLSSTRLTACHDLAPYDDYEPAHTVAVD